MALSAETLVRHELVGLAAAVRSSTNPVLESVAGDVVAETTSTLGIECPDGRVRHVPKDVATFAFTLPSGSVVTVEGERLVARPARRTEARGGSKWR